MFGFGTQELVIILVIAFFIFGGKKLPEIGAGLGKGLRSFKDGLKEVNDEIKKESDQENSSSKLENQEEDTVKGPLKS